MKTTIRLLLIEDSEDDLTFPKECPFKFNYDKNPTRRK